MNDHGGVPPFSWGTVWRLLVIALLAVAAAGRFTACRSSVGPELPQPAATAAGLSAATQVPAPVPPETPTLTVAPAEVPPATRPPVSGAVIGAIRGTVSRAPLEALPTVDDRIVASVDRVEISSASLNVDYTLHWIGPDDEATVVGASIFDEPEAAFLLDPATGVTYGIALESRGRPGMRPVGLGRLGGSSQAQSGSVTLLRPTDGGEVLIGLDGIAPFVVDLHTAELKAPAHTGPLQADLPTVQPGIRASADAIYRRGRVIVLYFTLHWVGRPDGSLPLGVASFRHLESSYAIDGATGTRYPVLAREDQRPLLGRLCCTSIGGRTGMSHARSTFVVFAGPTAGVDSLQVVLDDVEPFVLKLP